jgi:hypothetical protein
VICLFYVSELSILFMIFHICVYAAIVVLKIWLDIFVHISCVLLLFHVAVGNFSHGGLDR